MTAHRGLERRVRRLEEDGDAMFDIVTSIRATTENHGKRLERIEVTLHDHGKRLDRIDTRLDSIDTTLAEVLRRLPEPR